MEYPAPPSCKCEIIFRENDRKLLDCPTFFRIRRIFQTIDVLSTPVQRLSGIIVTDRRSVFCNDGIGFKGSFDSNSRDFSASDFEI